MVENLIQRPTLDNSYVLIANDTPLRKLHRINALFAMDKALSLDHLMLLEIRRLGSTAALARTSARLVMGLV